VYILSNIYLTSNTSIKHVLESRCAPFLNKQWQANTSHVSPVFKSACAALCAPRATPPLWSPALLCAPSASTVLFFSAASYLWPSHHSPYLQHDLKQHPHPHTLPQQSVSAGDAAALHVIGFAGPSGVGTANSYNASASNPSGAGSTASSVGADGTCSMSRLIWLQRKRYKEKSLLLRGYMCRTKHRNDICRITLLSNISPADSDNTASMIKEGGYINTRTWQPPTVWSDCMSANFSWVLL
jgi:hypothetical protein